MPALCQPIRRTTSARTTSRRCPPWGARLDPAAGK